MDSRPCKRTSSTEVVHAAGRFANLLETQECSRSTTVVPRFAHGPPSRGQVREMMSGLLKSLPDDGHQEGKMGVLDFQNPMKPFRSCGEALGLFEDHTAGLSFSFPSAKEILASPFCMLSQKLLAADRVCFGFCVFPSVVFRFN